jgi:hypothetical protein
MTPAGVGATRVARPGAQSSRPGPAAGAVAAAGKGLGGQMDDRRLLVVHAHPDDEASRMFG